MLFRNLCDVCLFASCFLILAEYRRRWGPNSTRDSTRPGLPELFSQSTAMARQPDKYSAKDTIDKGYEGHTGSLDLLEVVKQKHFR